MPEQVNLKYQALPKEVFKCLFDETLAILFSLPRFLSSYYPGYRRTSERSQEQMESKEIA